MIGLIVLYSLALIIVSGSTGYYFGVRVNSQTCYTDGDGNIVIQNDCVTSGDIVSGDKSSSSNKCEYCGAVS